MIEESTLSEILLRLKKVEGQIRGIQKMIENDRSRVDIINQIYAARKAINMVGLMYMKDHLETSVSDAIRSRNNDNNIDDLMATIYRFIK
jgi:DNA-binding FrmR family transcriptional regulator